MKILSLKPLLKDRLASLSLISSFILNLLLWIIIILFIKPTNELLPLHYTIYFGIDRLGRWHEILFIPVFGSVVFFVNSFFASLFFKKEKLVTYFLIISSAFAQLLLFLAIILLIIYT